MCCIAQNLSVVVWLRLYGKKAVNQRKYMELFFLQVHLLHLKFSLKFSFSFPETIGRFDEVSLLLVS